MPLHDRGLQELHGWIWLQAALVQGIYLEKIRALLGRKTRLGYGLTARATVCSFSFIRLICMGESLLVNLPHHALDEKLLSGYHSVLYNRL
jgi:hypothetical protein